jgi:hypothetical protein
MTRRNISRSVAWFICFHLVLAQTVAAFMTPKRWSKFGGALGPDHHKEITLAAFDFADYPECAVSIVADANTHQDDDLVGGDPLLPYHPESHFDRTGSIDHIQAFDRAADYFRSQKALVSRFGVSNPREGLRAMGRALHALQDFYAHSNYADLVDGLSFLEQVVVERALSDPGVRPPSNLKLTWFNPESVRDTNDPLGYPHGVRLTGVPGLDTLSFAKDFPLIGPEYGIAKGAAIPASANLLISMRDYSGSWMICVRLRKRMSNRWAL